MEKKLLNALGILLFFLFNSSDAMEYKKSIPLIMQHLFQTNHIDEETKNNFNDKRSQEIFLKKLRQEEILSDKQLKEIINYAKNNDKKFKEYVIILKKAIDEVTKEKELTKTITSKGGSLPTSPYIQKNNGPLNKTFSFSKKDPDSPLNHINILFKKNNESSEEEDDEEERKNDSTNLFQDELIDENNFLESENEIKSYKNNSVENQKKDSSSDEKSKNNDITQLSMKNDDNTDLHIIKIEISPENASPQHIIFNDNNTINYQNSMAKIDPNQIDPNNHVFMNSNNQSNDSSSSDEESSYE